VGFRAWGTDLADLFETAARAMFSLEYDVDTVPQDESPSVTVRGDDVGAGQLRTSGIHADRAPLTVSTGHNNALRPGLFLSIQDLQKKIGVGRTPIHQAVSRLAADTLIVTPQE